MGVEGRTRLQVHALSTAPGRTLFARLHGDYRRSYKYAGEA